MATITSAVVSGAYSATTSWVGGVVPVLGDKVIIATGHTITVDGTFSAGDDTATAIRVNGTLKASRSVSSTLTVRGELFIGVGGRFDWGTEADPIPAGITARVNLNDSATPASMKWGLSTDGAANWAGFSAWGASKTRVTTTTATALSTATTFAVGDTTGWTVGDVLWFGPIPGGTTGVARAIASVGAGTVTVGASLGNATHVGRYVVNVTRNVRFVGVSGNTIRVGSVIKWPDSFPTANAVEMGWCEWVGNGGTAPRNGAIQFETGFNCITAVVRKIAGVVAHSIFSVSGSTVALCPNSGDSGGVCFYAGPGATVTIDSLDCLNVGGTYALRPFANSSLIFKDGFLTAGFCAIQGAYGIGCLSLDMQGGVISGVGYIAAGSAVNVRIRNVTLDGVSQFAIGFQGSAPVDAAALTFSPAGIQSPTNLYSFGVGQLSQTTLRDSVVPASATVSFASSGFASQGSSNFFEIRNRDNDPTKQERWTRGGYIVRDNSTVFRSLSSLKFNIWSASSPTTIAFPLVLPASSTVQLRGYVRANTQYGTATPPTIVVTGPGISTVSYTAPAVTNTWSAASLAVVNPNAYPVTATITMTGSSAGAGNNTAACWFDGLVADSWVDWARHYGFAYAPSNPAQTVDPVVQLSESAAAALTGLAYSGGTLTITANRSLREVYDWLKWYECSNRLAPLITSADGVSFALSANLTISNASLTGSGVLDIGAGALTLTGTGDTTIPIKSAAGARVKIAAPALVSGTRVQVYDVTGAAELFNGVLSGTGLSLPVTWSTDRTIRLRADHATKLPLQTLGVLSSSGLQFLDVQADDTVYAGNGIDGSTVTEFAPDGANIQIDINDPDGVTQVQRLYAWMQHYQTTSAGIASVFFGALSAIDSTRYVINQALANILLDNVGATPVRMIGGTLERADGSTVIAASSNSIQIGTVIKVVSAPVITVPTGERLVTMQASGAVVARG